MLQIKNEEKHYIERLGRPQTLRQKCQYLYHSTAQIVTPVVMMEVGKRKNVTGSINPIVYIILLVNREVTNNMAAFSAL